MFGPLLEVEMSKKRTRLWRKAHFQVKMLQSTPTSNHFWKLRCRKRGRCCGAKHVSKSKCAKHTRFGPLFEVEMSKKWREADFQVKSAKNWRVRLEHFWRFRWGLRGRRKGLCTLPKVRGFVAFPKTMAGVRHLKRIWNDAFRVAGAVQETWSSEMLGGQGWFPERRCILEHQIFSFAKIILRDRCNTSYDLASLFRGRCSTLDRRSGENRNTNWYEAVSSALDFPFWKEVSQNCFVFDVVHFENWGRLAELLRFWRCQLQKLRMSRRLASCLTLSSWNIVEVSQNSFVFNLADRQIDRTTNTLHITLQLQILMHIYHATLHYTYYRLLHYTTQITLHIRWITSSYTILQ